MRVTAWVRSLVLGAVLLGGCASESFMEHDYVVQPGDTLYSIAWRHHLDYHELAQWNGLGTDFRISVGQRLVLGPGRVASRAPPAKPEGSSVPPTSLSAAGGTPGLREQPRKGRGPTPAAKPGDPSATIPHLNWVWPTDTVKPRAVQSGGILFLGRQGQDVRAAAAGRVVYTGSGIRGYGQLVIVKHGDTLLSAYAYNREALVKEGQEVTAGQAIAHMGLGPRQAAALYFEIRYNGKPIDPLPFLAGKK